MKLLFDSSAATYARYAVVQRRLAAWLAEWLESPERAATLSALEFGAGEGLFTSSLTRRFAHITAVELAPRLAAQGQRKLPQVRWCTADAWNYAHAPVDRLFSSSFLHWCDDPISVLQRWRTLMNDGGRMLHGFYAAPTLAEWQTATGISSPVVWRNVSQWRELFREAGWTILRSQTRLHVEPFPSALAVLRFFHRTGAVTPRQASVGALRRMLADFSHRSADPPGTARVMTTWMFFRIEACVQ